MRTSIGVSGLLFDANLLAQSTNLDDQALQQLHVDQRRRSCALAFCGYRVSAIDFAGGLPS